MALNRPQVALFAHGLPTAALLAAALRDGGADLLTLTAPPTREAARDAFTTAGPTERVIVAVASDIAGASRPLLDWNMAEWRQSADGAQLALLLVLQGLRDALGDRQCSVVVIGPGIGITGASGHSELATAAEGQRGLMKSLARQWAPQMRFAWLSVWTPLLFPDVAESNLPEQCELGEYAPPFGRPTMADVARTALLLSTPDQAITGQTTIVDGGEWMLP